MGLEMTAANNANAAAIASYSSKAAAATATAKANMNGALNNLANTVASNQKHVEKGLEVLTGVVRSYKAAGKADRALIRAQTKAIGQDLNKRIVRAIQIGEAKARRSPTVLVSTSPRPRRLSSSRSPSVSRLPLTSSSRPSRATTRP